jgi:hypothetical protein
MTTDTHNEELEAAITEAELTDDEATQARELLAGGGQVAAIVPFILSEREGGTGGDNDDVEQPPAGTVEPTAKQLKALENELVRHEKRVHEVMGEFAAGMVTCEHCNGIGLAEPGEPEPELQPHDYFKGCETCAGIGLVKTGSIRPGNSTRDCPTCRGRGYLEALKDGQPLASAPSLAEAAPAIETAAPVPPAGEQAASGVTFGTPAWMGDPALGQ